VAYAEVLGDEQGPTIAAFLRRAVAWFRRRGVRVERVLTACYERFVNRPSLSASVPLGGPIE
jgi:hypothetical protein